MRRDAEFILGRGWFLRRVMRHAQGEHGFLEEGREVIGGQAKRAGVNWQKRQAQAFKRPHGLQDIVPKTRQIRPLIGTAKAHLIQNIRMIRRQVALEEHSLIGIGQRHVAHRIHARGGTAHRHIADVMFVDLERQLRIQRLRMESRCLSEGLIEQRFGNAVIAHEVKAHLGEGMAEFFAEPVESPRRARTQRCKVQNGNAVSHGRLSLLVGRKHHASRATTQEALANWPRDLNPKD